MRLWLDDRRAPRDYGCPAWHWAKTAAEAIELLKTGDVTAASLDHDLGPDLTGYDVVVWMEQTGTWPQDGVWVHSSNTVGRARMRQVLDTQYPWIPRLVEGAFSPIELGVAADFWVGNREFDRRCGNDTL